MKASRLFVIATLIAKSSKFLKAASILKSAKLIKPLVTLFSMSASIIAYSFAFSIWFSVGLVAMLFIHEMGHVLAFKRKGFPASAPLFIPFLGAVIFAPKMGKSEDEAYIGYAGPLIGSTAALILFMFVVIVPNPPDVLVLISYIAVLLNLFNMIPLRPLDGGRVTQIIGGWFKWVGVAFLLILTIALRTPGMFLIWILVLSDLQLRPKLVFRISLICYFMMLVMIVIGYGDQPWWIDVLDIVIATLFILIYYLANNENFDFIDQNSQQSIVPRSIRNWWLLRYVLLLVALIVLMVLHVPFLPETGP